MTNQISHMTSFSFSDWSMFQRRFKFDTGIFCWIGSRIYFLFCKLLVGRYCEGLVSFAYLTNADSSLLVYCKPVILILVCLSQVHCCHGCTFSSDEIFHYTLYIRCRSWSAIFFMVVTIWNLPILKHIFLLQEIPGSFWSARPWGCSCSGTRFLATPLGSPFTLCSRPWCPDLHRPTTAWGSPPWLPWRLIPR